MAWPSDSEDGEAGSGGGGGSPQGWTGERGRGEGMCLGSCRLPRKWLAGLW